MALLLLGGALIWYGPALTTRGQVVAETPAPPGLFAAARYPLPGHGQACENTVTVTPQSNLAAFQLFLAGAGKGGLPPVELTLRSPGYQATSTLRAGSPGGSATLPLSPPKRPLIVTACFHNLGSKTVSLVGSEETRTISRSNPVTIDGREVPGDVALSFLESRPMTMLQQLGSIARHASNLTDGLLPPALIWLVAIATAFGVPVAMILAFRAALAEEQPVD